MNDPKAIAELAVYRGEDRVATLQRTKHGSLFRYTDEFLKSNEEPIARHLPKTESGIETQGTTNLPTYFAGLLAEGVMQDAIVRSAKLSKDDLFSQLAVSGHDAIGDISTRVPGVERKRVSLPPEKVRKVLDELLAGTLPLHISAVSGVQPKLSLGSAVASTRGTVAIVKIEPRAPTDTELNDLLGTLLTELPKTYQVVYVDKSLQPVSVAR